MYNEFVDCFWLKYVTILFQVLYLLKATILNLCLQSSAITLTSSYSVKVLVFFNFHLGLTIAPREIENNAYAKLWRPNKRIIWYFWKRAFMVFSRRASQASVKRRTFHETNQSWWVKFMERSTSGSVNFVWMSLDRPTTRSVRPLQTDWTSEDLLGDQCWSSHATN